MLNLQICFYFSILKIFFVAYCIIKAPISSAGNITCMFKMIKVNTISTVINEIIIQCMLIVVINHL